MKTKTFTKLITILFTVIISTNILAQNTDKIPITTQNKEALELYKKAIVAGEKAYIAKAIQLYEKATVLDPDFFMAYFQIALYQYYFKNDDNFLKYANKAVTTKVKLNDAEKIFKQILERWLVDNKSDVSDLGAKLIKLYPKDYYSHVYQNYFYVFAGKLEKAIEQTKKAIKLAKDEPSLYNTLGYNYLAVKKMKEAKKAFDKYIKLDPDEANPYDSKGDYFLANKEYQKAYDSFMKAYQINSSYTNSLKKAEKAKKIQESLATK